MGNCIKKENNYNEHSKIQRRLRIGIGIKKGEDGDFISDWRAGTTKEKTKI